MVSALDVLTRWPHDREYALEHVREIERCVVGISVAYLVAVFSLRAFMANRKPFQVGQIKFFKNFFLASLATSDMECRPRRLQPRRFDRYWPHLV